LNSNSRKSSGGRRSAETVAEFCRNIGAALDSQSFETKQRVLRMLVERVEFVEDQITIKHVVPISDVRLQRNDHLGNFLL
jgi:hypothetical protein